MKLFSILGAFAVVILPQVGCTEGTDSESAVEASESSLTATTAVEPAQPAVTPPVKAPVTSPVVTPAPEKKTVWVVMNQQANLAQARTTPDWKARGQMVYGGLTTTATTSQAGLRGWLAARGAVHKTFWIVNTLRVTADQGTIDEIAKRPDVARIVPDGKFSLPPIVKDKPVARTQSIEWGLNNIRAPEVWSQFGALGDGIVVANIDSGVEFDHPALVRQYRGNVGNGVFDHSYNWFDPARICAGGIPCDNTGHGTHTMGTMVGDDLAGNQIGVAPQAKWMAVKGCEDSGCSFESLMSAGQWILAPTDVNGQNPRPDLRPQVVNNSWGGGSGDTFYQLTVQAWVAAGIFPAFASGNPGPFCGAVSSPGDYPESYAVGAYDINNVIADFSGRGPAFIDRAIKPNIAGPGVNVRSSVPGRGYQLFSGTSMATPHLAGAVALLWSAAPSLVGDIAATRGFFDQAAVDSGDSSCGGAPENNNVWGQGRLDVMQTVSIAPHGPVGTLQGVVTNGAGEPLARATIHVEGAGVDRRTTTDATGAYRILLPAGTYTVSASTFGYASQVVTGVVIAVDTITVQNFALIAVPSFAVSGFVRDASGGAVAGARVTITGTPIATAITDVAGRYAFAAVPVGSYRVTVQAGGCFGQVSVALEVDGDETLDFVLPQRADAFGYSCRVVAYDFVTANTPLPLFGDDAGVDVPLPFPFLFYGQGYTTANVTTNGVLSFQPAPPNFGNVGIPDGSLPNAAIFGFWDDLIADSGSSVRTDTIGTAPNRRFVVEWHDMALNGRPDLRVSFQVQLFETGQILIQYQNPGLDLLQRGGSATAGIENENGDVGLQYSFNEAVLGPDLAVLYAAPPSGVVTGTVTDANDGLPIAGAQVQALRNGSPARIARTNAQGGYLMQVPVGDYVIEASLKGYGTAQAPARVAENSVIRVDFVLRTGRAAISPPTIQLTLTADQTRTRTLRLTNSGTAPLTFAVNESGGGRQATFATARLARNSVSTQGAVNTRGLFAPGVKAAGMAPTAAGDVIRSFVPMGLQLAWGVGYTGSNLWLGDAFVKQNHEFTLTGAPTGRNWGTPWASVFAADMTFDSGRNLLCQVNVEGDNGIYCSDPATGTVLNTITGRFPWTAVSQRGLAYRAEDDSFYIGGWNEGVVYHIAGLSDPAPGHVIGSCNPADGLISGLAYNAGMNVLWVATNSATDTIYEVNPDDCTVLSTLAHPLPGFNGGGLEMDDEGNLWTISQNPNQVFLIESGVPAISDVPWLSVVPTSGTIAAGRAQDLRVTVDTRGLTPGLYLATLFIRTDAGRDGVLRVPVSLVVSGYRQAVNAGGSAYNDSLGDPWAADRRYTTGQWGYVQRSNTASTTRAISGTNDPTLYRSQRIDPYAYRFDNVPNGVYQVDFGFAELQQNVRLGRRLFDVIVEDTVVLPAHDIFYEVGRHAAEARTFFVDVTNGQMDVRFVPRAGSEAPVVNALRVTHRPDR